MEVLIIYAVWAYLFIRATRYGTGPHVGPHQAPAFGAPGADWRFRGAPPERDCDPVCRKSVRTDRAKPSVHNGNIYYFCSRDCREIFEAAPDLYLAEGKTSRPVLYRDSAVH